MTTAKLALRLAFSSDPRQRWRQVSVALATAVAVTALLLAAALVSAAHDGSAHLRARSPLWATAGRPAVLDMSLRGITLPGIGQMPVVWLQPRPGHEGDPAAVPPGLRTLPAPGEAVLSEGLVRRGYTAESFGFKSSTAGLGTGGAIAHAGLQTSSEGWIYVRPVAGRSLGVGGALLSVRGYQGTGPRADLETTPEIPSPTAVGLGVLALLVLPSMFLLGGASRALSPVRDGRATVLWRLGVSSSRIRLLLGLETSSLAVVGVVVALAVWLVVVAHTRVLPLTGVLLFPEALTLPWPLMSALAVLVICLATAGAVLLTPSTSRASLRTRRVRAWHSAPLWLAFALMLAALYQGQASGLRTGLLLAGMLLTLLALPMALPSLVTGLGRGLGRFEHPAVWLAGRRLALRATNLSRPAAVVGAFVFVAGSAFAIYEGLTTREHAVVADEDVSIARVDWRAAQRGDIDRFLAASGHASAFPVRDTAVRPEVVVPSCSALREALRHADLLPCADEKHIPAEIGRLLDRLTGLSASTGTAAAVRQAGPPVVVFADGRIPEIAMLRAARELPAANIIWLTGGEQARRIPGVGWVILGWATGSLLFVLALTREVGERALLSLQESTTLLTAGLTDPEVRSVNRWSLLPPLALAIPIGYIAAVVFALMGYQLGLTASNLLRISAVAAGASILAWATYILVFWIHRATLRSPA